MGRSFLLAEVRLDRNPAIEGVTGLAIGRWHDQFKDDVRGEAGFSVARAIALIGPGIDCVFTFERVSLAGITAVDRHRIESTGGRGYPMLRESLLSDPGYDSVPLSVARTSRGITLWDGHRRFATYRSAGRNDVPAFVATFRRGSGLLSF